MSEGIDGRVDVYECKVCRTIEHVHPVQDPVDGKIVHLCHKEMCAIRYFSEAHPNPRTIPFQALHKINTLLLQARAKEEMYKKWKA